MGIFGRKAKAPAAVAPVDETVKQEFSFADYLKEAEQLGESSTVMMPDPGLTNRVKQIIFAHMKGLPDKKLDIPPEGAMTRSDLEQKIKQLQSTVETLEQAVKTKDGEIIELKQKLEEAETAPAQPAPARKSTRFTLPSVEEGSPLPVVNEPAPRTSMLARASLAVRQNSTVMRSPTKSLTRQL